MRVLFLASVWLHVLAAMTWLGGMVMFVVAVMPYFRRQSDAERAAFLGWFGHRCSALSWISLATLAVTGTFNLWARGVRPGDFLSAEWHATTFGQLVLLKLSLVAVAVVLTALHERPAAPAVSRWIGRVLMLVALAIVGVAVLLVRGL